MSEPKRTTWWRRINWWRALVIGFILVFILPGVIFFIVGHWRTRNLHSIANPTPNYTTAVALAEQVHAQEAALPLLDESQTRLLTHGHPTDEVVVLLHGMTNSPFQFSMLGELFFESGANVYIPRLPRHGMKDRAAANLSELTAEEMIIYGDQAVDIAAGLGDHITVIGLSAGGAVAANIAQNRPEVDRVILIAPALGFLPTEGNRLSKILYFFVPMLPEYVSERDEEKPGEVRPHTYLGFSSHALGQLLRLSAAVHRQALSEPPAVQDIVLISSASDDAVSEVIAWNLVGLWRKHQLRAIQAYRFPAEDKIPHDMIDPTEPSQNIELVYPILLSFWQPEPEADKSPTSE